jgi:L-ascorbate metabolism protein UlaG (beta-lactamase superfamily)
VIRLTWIGHATVVVDIGGVRLLTDPLLRPHAGPLRRIGNAPRFEQWRGTDGVLISHLHHDHTEIRSLRMLPGVPVVTGTANAPWLRKRLGASVDGLPLGEWTEVADGPNAVEVSVVRADHHHRPMPHRPNGAYGHLVRSSDEALWFAGDTSLYPEMAELPRLAGREIDVALVPIAGWGPRLSGGHLGPVEAAEACRLVRPRAVLPIHHGTLHARGHQHLGLDWMHLPVRHFADELARAVPDCRLLDVPLGGTVEVAPR